MCDINWDANFGLKQNINFGKADPLTYSVFDSSQCCHSEWLLS